MEVYFSSPLFFISRICTGRQVQNHPKLTVHSRNCYAIWASGNRWLVSRSQITGLNNSIFPTWQTRVCKKILAWRHNICHLWSILTQSVVLHFTNNSLWFISLIIKIKNQFCMADFLDTLNTVQVYFTFCPM